MTARWALALIFLAGCGLDTKVENRLTIDQGVYGQLILHCVGPPVGCGPEYLPDVRVAAFSGGKPQFSSTTGWPPAAGAVTSDERGFYELPLSPLIYGLCLIETTADGGVFTAHDCSEGFSLGTGLLRRDWTSENFGKWR